MKNIHPRVTETVFTTHAVPDRDFQLSYKCCDHDHVIIKCTTSGVFPKPKLTIMYVNVL